MKKVLILLGHAFVVWVLCAAVMGVGMASTTLERALVIHAIAAPLIAAAISCFYYWKYFYTQPLQTAIVFLSFVIVMDVFLVAIVINKSFDMFRSTIGTWLPFILIFTATYLTGIMWKKKKVNYSIIQKNEAIYFMVDSEYKKAEYNAFGPWILEITDQYPLPPLFIPYYKEDGIDLMRIKIPRNIERRNANPDMDLYDYVIGLYEDRIYILERLENDVKEIKILYDEIEGLENFVDILLGKFTIFLSDRKVIIPYNAVSDQIINSMIRIIRDRYIGKSYQKLHGPYGGEKNNIKETLYINLLDQLRVNNETFDITVIQPSVMLQRNKKGIRQKALQFLYGEKLLSSLHLANENEILVISRGKPFKTRADVVSSYSHIYIPIEKLQSIIIEKDDYFCNLQRLYMKTNKHTFLFYFDESNKESMDYYRDLGYILNG